MSAFARRLVQLEPGADLDHRESQWQHAIVFLLAGELAVECSHGQRHCFRAGDILTLARLPISRAHNSGPAATRLLAIWRASPVSLAPADRHTDKDPDPE
jgi:quercetin dioxygenase-like cupin family protein